MLFNSVDYFIFLCVVVPVYSLLPHGHCWILLLAARYHFCMCWNAFRTLPIVLTCAAAGAGPSIPRRVVPGPSP